LAAKHKIGKKKSFLKNLKKNPDFFGGFFSREIASPQRPRLRSNIPQTAFVATLDTYDFYFYLPNLLPKLGKNLRFMFDLRHLNS
jgi:hypothetical protein